MKQKYHLDGVPVTIEMNKTGEITKALIGERGQYVVEPREYGGWRAVFMQMGDNGPFRSSNSYTDRWFLNKETDINVIIEGLVEDGYFPECPGWVKNHTYYPDYDAPILERVWSYSYDGPTWDDDISNGKFNKWSDEASSIANSLTLKQQGVINEMGHCACDILNILEEIIYETTGIPYIDIGGPAKNIKIIDKETELVCKLLLDVSNSIGDIYYDDYISDPGFQNPIPDSSCCLEDLN